MVVKNSMRYVFLTQEEVDGTIHHKQEEIPFIKVQDLIIGDTQGNGQATQKIRDLKKFGWVSLKKGIIEWRQN